MTAWSSVPFPEAVQDVSRGNIKVPQREYLAFGKLPVVDQGSDTVGGYTDDETAAIKSELPVIVFGDHTRALKFVDFPFAMGADGVKVLKVRRGWDPRFVYHYLRHLDIPSAGYSRHFKFLKEREVPVVPIEEQRRIAAILDRADALWDNRRAALDRLGELRQSIFNDTFHAHEWPLVESSQIIVGMRNGISPSAKGKIPGRVLTLSAVTGGEFDPSQAKDAMFSSRPAPNQHVRRGHVLICRGNGNISLVGRAVVAQEDHPGLVIPDTVIGAELDTSQVVPTYFAAAWQQRSTRNQIESSARTTSGIHKVNQQTLGEVRIPLPPISVQKEFAERVANVRSFERRLRAHALSIHAMVASLQSRAFSGRL